MGANLAKSLLNLAKSELYLAKPYNRIKQALTRPHASNVATGTCVFRYNLAKSLLNLANYGEGFELTELSGIIAS